MYQIRLRIEARFRQRVKRHIAKMGLGLTPACQELVDKLIAVGVSRLEHQKALEREAQLVLSEENLFRCISTLQERATYLGTYPLVDVDAFNQMHKKLSPLWPFC